MSRWNYLPSDVATALTEKLLRALADFRSFFSRASQEQHLEICAEYLLLVEKVKVCFEHGLLSWVRALEQDCDLGLSLNYRTAGMLLSKHESLAFLLQQVEATSPRQLANMIGKSVTDLSFLRLEVARRIHQAHSQEARKFLWALHKLIAQSIRSLINSGMFFHFPNTPHGERFSEETMRQVAKGLSHEYQAITRFRSPLEAGQPRDFLSQLLGDPIFEIFADHWDTLRLLTPTDVDSWLSTRYPIHRRSLPARIASAIGRAGRQSLILRVQLARPWEEITLPRKQLSLAEDVGDVLTHTLLRTGALESFPQ